MDDAVLDSLRRALEANPGDIVLRLHLAQSLLGAGDAATAITEASRVLQDEPGNAEAVDVLSKAAAVLSAPPQTATEFDWTQAEREIDSTVPAPFIEENQAHVSPDGESVSVAPAEIAGSTVTLADVGGLEDVKTRLDESFLAPMRNAAIAKAFGKSLRGGLLLYGPPGCGKTFLARAVAGELGATFMSVTMTDILGSLVGETEQNLKAVFDQARAESPTVLFLDEIDSIGMRRGSISGGGGGWLRQMVAELLLQLDSMGGNNDGLYVLAATNNPWDLDEALLRPGRLDRSILVRPPDDAARVSILRHHLKDRPLAGINLEKVAGVTDGFSGADLEHVCVTAAEKAMMQSISAGSISPISMTHIETALGEINPSTTAWLEAARNVVKFSNANGRYDDLAELLKSRKML